MALEIDEVAAARIVPAAEEMIEADFIERSRGSKGGDVSAQRAVELVRLHDHGHGIPADQALDSAFHLAIAREERLTAGGDGVDVRRVRGERDFDAVTNRLMFQLGKEI